LPAHPSNADRIARAAAESAAAVKELTAKRVATASIAKKARARPVRVPPRIKIVWAVGRPGAGPVKSFPYPERAAADAEAARLGKGCIVSALKVPMV